MVIAYFFFSSRRRHTRCLSDWSSDVCSSDLLNLMAAFQTIAIQDTNRTAAQEQLQLATDRYSIGSGSFLELRSEERRVGKECSARRWRVQCHRKQKGTTRKKQNITIW